MVSEKNYDDVERTGKWPCVVCWKGVRSNSGGGELSISAKSALCMGKV